MSSATARNPIPPFKAQVHLCHINNRQKTELQMNNTNRHTHSLSQSARRHLKRRFKVKRYKPRERERERDCKSSSQSPVVKRQKSFPSLLLNRVSTGHYSDQSHSESNDPLEQSVKRSRVVPRSLSLSPSASCFTGCFSFPSRPQG